MTAGVAFRAACSAARQAVDSSTVIAKHEPLDETQSSGLDATFVDPLSGSRWDDLLARHPEATVFHTSAWARVLAKTYGHKPSYLHLSRGGESAALLPLMEVASRFTGRRGVCLPFSDFCPPLFFGDCSGDTVANRLYDLAVDRKWKYVEWRGASATDSRETLATFYGHTLDLSRDEEAIFARFHPSVQRAIRKAEKSGVLVDISQDPVAMGEFYELHCRTRKLHGVPPQPFAFFRHIQEEIIAPGLGFIALARSAGGCIAASVFFRRNHGGLYKFGASERKYQSLRPNHLIMWNAIRHLLHLGCRSLHFGRTAPGNEGLRRFKLSWGTSEEMLSYLRFDPREKLPISVPPPAAGLHEKLFAKLPLALGALAGRLIYPHLD